MDNIQKRQKKYTAKYYRLLKLKNNYTWKQVPFICIQCGAVFHREDVKPKSLPVNCSKECRAAGFDPSIGAMTAAHLEDIDWKKVRRLIDAGKSGPEVKKAMGMKHLNTLHKYVKKKMGVKVLGKMIATGKKRRLQGLRVSLAKKR